MFSYSAFLSYVIITTFTPGPNNIMSMTNGHQVGFKKSMPFSLGVGFGFSLLFLLSLFFNEFLSQHVPSFVQIVKFVGVAYILYLAFSLLRSDFSASTQKKSNLSFTKAVVLQFVNPKGVLYALTVTSTFILPYFDQIHDFLLFALLLGVISVCSNVLWSLFGVSIERFFQKYEKLIKIIFVGLLLYVAISILR